MKQQTFSMKVSVDRYTSIFYNKEPYIRKTYTSKQCHQIKPLMEVLNHQGAAQIPKTNERTIMTVTLVTMMGTTRSIVVTVTMMVIATVLVMVHSVVMGVGVAHLWLIRSQCQLWLASLVQQPTFLRYKFETQCWPEALHSIPVGYFKVHIYILQ